MDSSFLWPLLTEAGWRQQLSHLFGEKFFKLLDRQVQQAYSQVQVLPPQEDIFRAFNLTPLNKVKVVILGQDPYHDIGQAHGLSFSVPRGMKIPPSLRNIYKELSTDYPGFKAPNHGCLEEWAERGVLLLNATLTVQAHKPNSHAQFGWQLFTDDVIRALSGHLDGVVFVLWGEFAKKKKKLINLTKHRVIETAHPSPLSCRFFFGCKCFSKTNEELKKLKKGAIDWTLSP
ncbi:hypothetical protein CAPTEDRAFT_173370 [Capitella teleta]|uniref:Uracil-DNA glycosylase n=1 Tax=Capitella teleta TaxID=283909 RepID=R7VGS3_CAPTE|nr:hypothetical protein CAPTEDRAFT_173370 [Capitella teleta]|eukprot:ELU18043.1 hypothetical protein CAPTEDRAFT_173370 [Capitella teleta]